MGSGKGHARGGVFVGVSALLLAGCAGSGLVKTPTQQLDGHAGDNLATVTYQKPNFGMLSSGDDRTDGNRLVEAYAINDPAGDIAFNLTALAARRLKPVGFVALPGQNPTADQPPQLANVVGHRGLIFDVKTLDWNISNFPGEASRYRVSYLARARLIDARSGKLVGQVPCAYASDDRDSAPTYAQLVADDARLLKDKLATAIRDCQALIAHNLLGIDDSPVLAGSGHAVAASTKPDQVEPANVTLPKQPVSASLPAAVTAAVPVPAAAAAQADADPAAASAPTKATDGVQITLNAGQPEAPAVPVSVPAPVAPLPASGTPVPKAVDVATASPPVLKPIPAQPLMVTNGAAVLAKAIALRNAPVISSASTATMQAGEVVTVGSRVVNAGGIWRFLIGSHGSGWVLESELSLSPPTS